ncbi:hypothetical protein PMAYCL1PPCAC_15045, partial [Pristionchus mayeri]
LPLIEKADEGRIVIVSAKLHDKVDHLVLGTIDDEKAFAPLDAYNKSKLANIMHARELTRRLRAMGNKTVTANSLHPGVFPSELLRHLGPLKYKIITTIGAYTIMKTERDGAQTSLFLALSPKVKGLSGFYFSDCALAEEESHVARDDLACKQLYDYSLKAVGLE